MAGAHVAGHDLRVLVAATERREALFALIGSAQSSLRLLYYIFADDETGRAVIAALVDACRRGVVVTLMVDAFGSSSTPDSLFAPLQAVGGRFVRFGSSFTTRYLVRNHQKMTIADGGRALIGGFNVADDYFAPESEDGWHDLGLAIAGEQVGHLVLWFDRLWRWRTSPNRSFLHLRRMIRRWDAGYGRLRWLIGGPTYRLSPWARMVWWDLEHASRADIVAAYFSPGQRLLRRLAHVASRAMGTGAGEVPIESGGVRLLLPSRSDNSTTIAASRLLYGPLIRDGVQIHEYLSAKLHMKLIVIDDVVYLGSANFDLRSLFINLEIMLRIEDAAFADEMRALVDRQMPQCLEITQQVHQQRKRPWRLLKGWISYFLVCVLDFTVTRRFNFAEDEPGERRWLRPSRP